MTIIPFRLSVVAVAFQFLVACGHAPPRPYLEVKLLPSTLDKQAKIAFVAVSNGGQLGPTIPQMATTNQEAMLVSATRRILPRPSQKAERDNTYKAFVHALEDDGFTVVGERTNLYGLDANYLDLLSWHGDEVRYDFSDLAKRTQADLVFCIEYIVPRFMQSHEGPFTLGSPRAVTAVIGSLINPHSKTLLWQHLEVVEEPVVGEWDEPPQYPKLEKAMLKSLEQAFNQTFFSFFKRAP